ncbi:hypothetical protein E8E11_007250 [Didymella keratinophila]|nr:hypothetical protein E8E11_007250 [Didymella keratinophila]
MLIQENSGQARVEFQLRNDTNQLPNIKDLGHLLELSASLKEMGVSFSKNGQIWTCGDPPLNEDLEWMLELGTEYDTLWHTFFTGRKQEIEHKLRPIPHVLKKMLQNEGVAFDDRHTRLDHGSGTPKLMRLGGSYDLLREEWFQKTLSDVHPAFRWGGPPARAKIPKAPVNVGWSFTRDELPEYGLPRKDSHLEKRLTIIAEKQPSMRSGLSPTIQKEQNAHSSLPDAPGAAISVPLETPGMPSAAAAAAVRPLGIASTASALVYGPSPLQRANTASEAKEMLQGLRPRRQEHIGVLGQLVEDERRRAKELQGHGAVTVKKQSTEMQVAEKETLPSCKDGKKGKGVKKWLRSIFEDSEFTRSMDRMGRNAGGEF